MQIRKRLTRAMPIDRARLMNAFRQAVSSVRAARRAQPEVEKERQMRRLMRYMRGNPVVRS